jgi:hypothetical protein
MQMQQVVQVGSDGQQYVVNMMVPVQQQPPPMQQPSPQMQYKEPQVVQIGPDGAQNLFQLGPDGQYHFAYVVGQHNPTPTVANVETPTLNSEQAERLESVVPGAGTPAGGTPPTTQATPAEAAATAATVKTAAMVAIVGAAVASATGGAVDPVPAAVPGDTKAEGTHAPGASLNVAQSAALANGAPGSNTTELAAASPSPSPSQKASPSASLNSTSTATVAAAAPAEEVAEATEKVDPAVSTDVLPSEHAGSSPAAAETTPASNPLAEQTAERTASAVVPASTPAANQTDPFAQQQQQQQQVGQNPPQQQQFGQMLQQPGQQIIQIGPDGRQQIVQLAPLQQPQMQMQQVVQVGSDGQQYVVNMMVPMQQQMQAQPPQPQTQVVVDQFGNQHTVPMQLSQQRSRFRGNAPATGQQKPMFPPPMFPHQGSARTVMGANGQPMKEQKLTEKQRKQQQLYQDKFRKEQEAIELERQQVLAHRQGGDVPSIYPSTAAQQQPAMQPYQPQPAVQQPQYGYAPPPQHNYASPVNGQQPQQQATAVQPQQQPQQQQQLATAVQPQQEAQLQPPQPAA